MQNSNQTEIMNSVFLTHCCYIVQNSDHRNFTDAENNLQKELKPKVGEIQHGQSSFIPVHRPMFLDNKNNLTFKTILTESGKRKGTKTERCTSL